MSDLLIRGMEMPTGGYRTLEIAFDADGHPMALADGGDVFDVIPIKQHGRLGDLDALAEYVHQQDDWLSETAIHAFCGILCKTPAIIPADPLNEEVNE